MMALIVLIGDEEFEVYELRLLEVMEPFDEDDRRNEVRMLEKEKDWKPVERMIAL